MWIRSKNTEHLHVSQVFKRFKHPPLYVPNLDPLYAPAECKTQTHSRLSHRLMVYDCTLLQKSSTGLCEKHFHKLWYIFSFSDFSGICVNSRKKVHINHITSQQHREAVISADRIMASPQLVKALFHFHYPTFLICFTLPCTFYAWQRHEGLAPPPPPNQYPTQWVLIRCVCHSAWGKEYVQWLEFMQPVKVVNLELLDGIIWYVSRKYKEET